ncbi:divergent PAP2 family protein [Entomospira culicis]|uniref:Divergent PAP2 family protein n=1 Tax=Entomospira culicis TaxID=2719989 RepID=A0A968GE54_9SPIO|nr:divergent PAP2 family protein [Entomospira culicis]NIZ18706.1 divergent PAP2 family protein [Entomospira culicis]NIZ68921.1 divergent PAP2 family protein [Entomospira culicis]WDI37514.1 divergent PAP2 family protein [Entomospira culicis]WDI39142.1 divergent PAP2 family protein [Entomospira culicis]
MYLFIQKYIFIITPFTAWVLAQWLKPLFEYLRTGSWDVHLVKGAGGMPSSHSSTMISLTTILGFARGVQSDIFALSFVTSLIVMYDARGVRQAAGSHAVYLNYIKDELTTLFGRGFTVEGFKTNLGHTSLQVAAGALLGLIIGLIYGFTFFH